MTRAFWLGDFDARRLALFRIVFGAVVLARLWALPTVDLASGWPMRLVLLAVGYGVFGALILGHRTRGVVVLAFCVLTVFSGASLVLLDGAERAVRLVAFWMIWTDLGASWSLDTVRGAQPSRRFVVALAPRFVQLQLVIGIGLAMVSGALQLGCVLGAFLVALAFPIDRALALLGRRIRPATVIFDGRCTFCRRSMEQLLRLDVLQRLVPRDAHDPAVRAELPALDPERCQREIVLVRADGAILGGFDAFRALAWRLPALWLVAPFLYLPLVPFVGRRVYRKLAARRFELAGACKIGPLEPLPRPTAEQGPARREPHHLALAALLALQLALVGWSLAARTGAVPPARFVEAELRLVGLSQPPA